MKKLIITPLEEDLRAIGLISEADETRTVEDEEPAAKSSTDVVEAFMAKYKFNKGG